MVGVAQPPTTPRLAAGGNGEIWDSNIRKIRWKWHGYEDVLGSSLSEKKNVDFGYFNGQSPLLNDTKIVVTIIFTKFIVILATPFVFF